MTREFLEQLEAKLWEAYKVLNGLPEGDDCFDLLMWVHSKLKTAEKRA